MVRTLLAAGADPNLGVAGGGGNALVGARANGHSRCVEALEDATTVGSELGPVAAALSAVLAKVASLEPRVTRMPCWFPRGRCNGDDKGGKTVVAK